MIAGAPLLLSVFGGLLAQGAVGGSDYRPFLSPLPVWNVWYVLLVPLCAGVAVVWKSVKCDSMQRVPRQAAELLFWILMTMALVGAGLVVVVKGTEWWIGN